MSDEERNGYINKVLNIYARKKLYLSVNISDKELAAKELAVLKEIGTARFRDKFAYHAAKNKLIKAMFKLAKKLF